MSKVFPPALFVDLNQMVFHNGIIISSFSIKCTKRLNVEPYIVFIFCRGPGVARACVRSLGAGWRVAERRVVSAPFSECTVLRVGRSAPLARERSHAILVRNMDCKERCWRVLQVPCKTTYYCDRTHRATYYV